MPIPHKQSHLQACTEDSAFYLVQMAKRFSASLFTDMLIGSVRWTTGEVKAATPPNLKELAPEAHINLTPGAGMK